MEQFQNQLFTGDARERLPALPSTSVRLCVTSPPYNVDADYGAYDDRRSLSAWQTLIQEVFSEVYRLIKPDGKLCVILGASYDSTDTDDRYRRISLRRHLHDVLGELGFSFMDEVVWTKKRYTAQDESALLGSYPYPSNLPITQQHEYVLIFRKPSPPDAEVDRPEPESERYEASKIPHEKWKEWTQSVWEIPPADTDAHEAPFPVALARRLVKLYSFVGDAVLDPFVGSGTTAVAAKQANRAYVGIDQNEDYVKHARERVAGRLDTTKATLTESEEPADIPQYVLDGLNRQDPQTLRKIAGYAHRLATEREQVSLETIEDEIGAGETLEDVRRTHDGAIVEKMVPCGSSCDGCPHGPYKYRVYRDGGTVAMDYLGPVK